MLLKLKNEVSTVLALSPVESTDVGGSVIRKYLI